MSRPIILTDGGANSRFWVTEPAPEHTPYGEDTDAVVDDQFGGIILYCHKDHSARIILGLLLAEVAQAWHE
jgi:hypothetical protein